MGDTLICGDCLQEMKSIPDASIDLILTDLPYGTTQNAWDCVIPFEGLWSEYKRISKPDSAIVLTCTQPFTSALAYSNLRNLKYSWVWKKSIVTGHLNARRRPMRNHEDILVFSYGSPAYYPQGIKDYGKIRKRGHNGSNFNSSGSENFQPHTNFPRTILEFPSDIKDRVHPTQKPVALMEYLIKTYTREGECVLDSCMGSGSTALACLNSGRRFIGIEKDPVMFTKTRVRIDRHGLLL